MPSFTTCTFRCYKWLAYVWLEPGKVFFQFLLTFMITCSCQFGVTVYYCKLLMSPVWMTTVVLAKFRPRAQQKIIKTLLNEWSWRENRVATAQIEVDAVMCFAFSISSKFVCVSDWHGKLDACPRCNYIAATKPQLGRIVISDNSVQRSLSGRQDSDFLQCCLFFCESERR